MTDNPSSSVPVSKGAEVAAQIQREMTAWGPGSDLFLARMTFLIDSALASQEARHQKDTERLHAEIKDREMMRDAWERRAHELIAAEARHRQEMEEARRERDEALDFLRRAAYSSKEIVSTCRLTAQNIDNYRRAGLMYVEPGGGLGWVVREATPAWWSGERAEQLEKRAEAAEQREREAGEAIDAVLEAIREQPLTPNVVRDRALATLAAIRSASSPVSAPRELAWLIEHGTPPVYWAGSHDWTPDHMEAVRFARKVDAERVMTGLSLRGKWDPKVVEHMWTGAAPVSAPPMPKAHRWIQCESPAPCSGLCADCGAHGMAVHLGECKPASPVEPGSGPQEPETR